MHEDAGGAARLLVLSPLAGYFSDGARAGVRNRFLCHGDSMTETAEEEVKSQSLPR